MRRGSKLKSARTGNGGNHDQRSRRGEGSRPWPKPHGRSKPVAGPSHSPSRLKADTDGHQWVRVQERVSGGKVETIYALRAPDNQRNNSPPPLPALHNHCSNNNVDARQGRASAPESSVPSFQRLSATINEAPDNTYDSPQLLPLTRQNVERLSSMLPPIAATPKQEWTEEADIEVELDQLKDLMKHTRYEDALHRYHRRPTDEKHDFLLFYLIQDCRTRFRPKHKQLPTIRKAQTALRELLSSSPYRDNQLLLACKLSETWTVDLFKVKHTVFEAFMSAEGMDMANFLITWELRTHPFMTSYEKVLWRAIAKMGQKKNSNRDSGDEAMKIGLFVLALGGGPLRYDRSGAYDLAERSVFTCAAGFGQLEEAVLLYETGAVCYKELFQLPKDDLIKINDVLQTASPTGTFLRSCITQPRSLLSAATIEVSALLGGGPWLDRVRRAQSLELPANLVDMVLFKAQVCDYWLAKGVANVNAVFDSLMAEHA